MAFIDLGKVTGHSMPIAGGHFQDRSLTANTWTIITPICDVGESGMILGNRFVAPEPGWYSLFCEGGAVNTSTTGFIGIYLNETSNTNDVLLSYGGLPSNTIIPFISAEKYLDEGEYFVVKLYYQSAQTTIHNAGRINRFVFRKFAD